MKTVPMISWNQAIKSKLQCIWIYIYMGQLFTKFDVAKHPRFLSDRKIIKTEGFEVTTMPMQSSNLYRNMCDLRPTTARLQSLHWEAFKPNKTLPWNPQFNQFNFPTIPWSSELTTGGTLSKANALASLLTTLTVAARGSLRNRARSPKYCLRQWVVGRIWPASWKDYKKKVIEKLRYEHSLEAILILGSVPSSIKPIVWWIPPDVWPMFGRYKVPEPYFNSGPFTSHWWLIILAIIFHISFTWIFVKRAARVISCTHYFWAPRVTPDLTTLLELNIQKPWPWWLLRCRTPNQPFAAWKRYGNSTGSNYM